MTVDPVAASPQPQPRRRRALGAAFAGGLLLLLAAAVLAGCCCGQGYVTAREVIDEAQPTPPLQPPVPPTHQPTTLLMKNVQLRQADTFFLEVRHLLGLMIGTHEDGIPVFGDPTSYLVRVQRAEVAMSGASLTGLLNNHVFAYPGAPLRHLLVEMTPDGHLKQRGIMHKVIDIPFTITAEVKPTPDGKLRIHPIDIEICNLDGEGLMKAVGVEMEDLLDLSKAKGITVEGNDLVLDPARALPPPQILGRITAIRIEADRLVQVIGPAPDTPHVEPPPAPPDSVVPNFMHLYGGIVRFGRLYMVGTNLQIADAFPKDPFEFYLLYYQNQLAAGYSRSYLDDSLTTYMPDFPLVGKTVEPGDLIAVAKP
jgi:hypothetical protein